MANRSEIREFLASRRARITPQQAGMPLYGAGRRRVPGLRREEVALLAGVSVDYYTRLERGDVDGVSDVVLDAVAAALALDDAERAHLFDLAHVAPPRSKAPRRTRQRQVRPSVHRLLEAMTGAPAFVRDGRLDVLAANRLARALYSPLFAGPDLPPNLARFVFLDPRARDLYVDWDEKADGTVAGLRTEAGRDPHDAALSELVDELTVASDAFRARWAAHDVRIHSTGVTRFRHPLAGEMTLTFEALALTADSGLTVIAYTDEAGSASRAALDRLTDEAAAL